MMTRREKLLIRPWQLRKYNNHKKKVINATPIVDFGPPPHRRHVTVKLKKLQKERERQMKIEEDNFKLLQHLGSIMKKKRVDNFWETKPPNFLRRVGIYHKTRTPTPCEETSTVTTPETSTTRKSKCWACTPHQEEPITIPEERIPWALPKKILTRRRSGSAIVPITSDFDFPKDESEVTSYHRKSQTRKADSANKKEKSLEMKSASKKMMAATAKSLELPPVRSDKKLTKIEQAEQKVLFCQGSLKIAVNFPSFAEVKLVQGKSEKFLQRNFCECKSFRAIK